MPPIATLLAPLRPILLPMAAAGIVSAASTAWASEARTNADVLANLATIVFGSEFRGEDHPVVRKWTVPLRVAVYGDDRGRYRDLLEEHLGLLHRLTGLDLRIVERSDAGQNVRVLFLGDSQFRDYMHRYLPTPKNPNLVSSLACFGLFSVDARDEIDSATAVIPSSLPRSEVKACIVEELTQVLGLPNDSFDVAPTVFNDDEAFQELTWQDELFVRVVYDRRVTPGMQPAAFKKVARMVLDELRPGR